MWILVSVAVGGEEAATGIVVDLRHDEGLHRDIVAVVHADRDLDHVPETGGVGDHDQVLDLLDKNRLK